MPGGLAPGEQEVPVWSPDGKRIAYPKWMQQSKAGVLGPQGRKHCGTAVKNDAGPDGEREVRR